MRITLLLYLLFIFTINVNGQNFTVQNFTDENGLPQNSVKSIATDNAGFVWLATENGLVRYDGRNFSLFDKNKTKAKSNRISSITTDPKNLKLYGITEYWELIEIKNGNVSSKPIAYESVFSFENSTYKSHYFTLGVPNGFESYVTNAPYIIEKNDGELYKIFNHKISFYEKNKHINTIDFNYKDYWGFFVFENELYHITKELKLTKFEKNKAVDIKLNGDLVSLIGKQNGRLFWNANSQNVFIYAGRSLFIINKDKKSNKTTSLKIFDNLNLDGLDVKSVFRNKVNGDIYIGTSTKGLFIYKNKQFNTLITPDNYQNNVFYAQIPFENNGVLFANGYLFNNNIESRIKLFEQHSWRSTMAIDSDKNIFTSLDQYVFKLSPDLKKVITSYKFPTTVNAILYDEKQEIWAGNTKGIYNLKKGDTSFKQVLKLNKIDSVSFLAKSNNKLWIGTSRGLLFYDIEKDKQYIIKGLENKNVRSIYLRNDETWITTYGDGYYLLNKGKLIRLPNDKNNYLNTAHCILEDKNGFFWISTNKGLFKASIADLLAYSLHQTTNVYYAYFNRTAGFNTNEFNGGCQPCGSIIKNGNFTFPTMNGAVIFNPSKIEDNLPNKQIYVDKIILDNKELTFDTNKVEIPNKFNRLKIQISTPYFGNTENLSFEYKLSNQKNWNEITDGSLIFSSLPTGKFILNIRKLNGFGLNNYSYKNINLIVPPYFYETWWFILGTLTCICLIIYFYIKLRMKLIRERNLQLEKSINESTLELQSTIKAYEFSEKRLDHQNYFQSRLIGAITHDIKSPLKYLMMTGEALYKNNAKEVDKEGLKAIYTSSSQIYHFTDNLLQYAKGFTTKDLDTKQTFNLYELIEDKISIFKPIAKTQNTTIINNIGIDTFIKTNEQLLSVILHNLLDNAVKFTYNGKINFSFTKLKHSYKITINDNGIGLKQYQVDWCNSDDDSLNQTKSIENRPSPAGLGLIMVKELNKIINGELKVKAVEGEGTTFEITLAD